MEVYTKVDELSWDPHPFADDVKIKPLVTKRDDELNVSCLLAKVSVGIEIAEHTHEEQVDILYPLKGRAEMSVEQANRYFYLGAGCCRPRSQRGEASDFKVTDELIIYDVFHPATM
jgi:quercetin dioxygenase-like cupin family protein